ncbi:Uncharacterised protein [Mycobacteroides abscessus subsp. abscessus]|nr:Uncharacterised protein [Mycobacteroides abscessus subsp. abscessus]
MFCSSDRPVSLVASIATQDSTAASTIEVSVPSNAEEVRRFTPCAR